MSATTRKERIRFEETVQTIDATETTLGYVTLPDESVALVEVRVVGRLNTGTAAGYIRIGTFQQEVAGTTVLVGVLDERRLYSAEDAVAWDVKLDINGANVRLRVTGVVNTGIDWLASFDVLLYSP